MLLRSFRTLLLLAVAALAVALAGPPPASAAAPGGGFNDDRCRPSAAHPRPVLLLHGLGGNGPGNYLRLGPQLAADGYCVWAPTYGMPLPPIPVGGLNAIDASAREVAGIMDGILARTGAAKLDVVGHSEGGFLSLYVPKKIPGQAAKIDRVVALAPPTHGTSFAGLVDLGHRLGIMKQVNEIMAAVGCVACTELTTGAPTIARLNDGPIAQPGISYTVIASTSDALVTPRGVSFVREPGVTNLEIQDRCPADTVGHIGLAYSGTVAALVGNTFDPAHPKPVPCERGLPF
ncbi:esterase/lipase family protein [Actinomadura flavalba]|uniref:esterase/lipase family protein n=1 Tax=Actinomadura flavalba TaxID=1120938 RepID=UPI0003A6E21C|nr:alpha/beta fold hydrolase [Actinomadura flavalba]